MENTEQMALIVLAARRAVRDTLEDFGIDFTAADIEAVISNHAIRDIMIRAEYSQGIDAGTKRDALHFELAAEV